MVVFDTHNYPFSSSNNSRTTGNINSFQQLATELGIPCHDAPADGKAECALLERLGIVDAVWSDDLDALVFGAQLLICPLIQDGKKSTTHVSVYRAEDIKLRTGLDRDGLVLFALLCGRGHEQPGIEGCNPELALEAVKSEDGRLVKSMRTVATRGNSQQGNTFRQDIERFFRKTGRSFHVPQGFPDPVLLKSYRFPIISSQEECEHSWSSYDWNETPLQETLHPFLQDHYNFSAEDYVRHVLPVSSRYYPAVRRLTLRGPQVILTMKLTAEASNAINTPFPHGIRVITEAKNMKEQNLWEAIAFDPVLLSFPSVPKWTYGEQGWGLTTLSDGTVFDTTLPVRTDMLECILQHGLGDETLSLLRTQAMTEADVCNRDIFHADRDIEVQDPNTLSDSTSGKKKRKKSTGSNAKNSKPKKQRVEDVELHSRTCESHVNTTQAHGSTVSGWRAINHAHKRNVVSTGEFEDAPALCGLGLPKSNYSEQRPYSPSAPSLSRYSLAPPSSDPQGCDSGTLSTTQHEERTELNGSEGNLFCTERGWIPLERGFDIAQQQMRQAVRDAMMRMSGLDMMNVCADTIEELNKARLKVRTAHAAVKVILGSVRKSAPSVLEHVGDRNESRTKERLNLLQMVKKHRQTLHGELLLFRVAIAARIAYKNITTSRKIKSSTGSDGLPALRNPEAPRDLKLLRQANASDVDLAKESLFLWSGSKRSYSCSPRKMNSPVTNSDVPTSPAENQLNVEVDELDFADGIEDCSSPQAAEARRIISPELCCDTLQYSTTANDPREPPIHPENELGTSLAEGAIDFDTQAPRHERSWSDRLESPLADFDPHWLSSPSSLQLHPLQEEEVMHDFSHDDMMTECGQPEETASDVHKTSVVRMESRTHGSTESPIFGQVTGSDILSCGDSQNSVSSMEHGIIAHDRGQELTTRASYERKSSLDVPALSVDNGEADPTDGILTSSLGSPHPTFHRFHALNDMVESDSELSYDAVDEAMTRINDVGVNECLKPLTTEHDRLKRDIRPRLRNSTVKPRRGSVVVLIPCAPRIEPAQRVLNNREDTTDSWDNNSNNNKKTKNNDSRALHAAMEHHTSLMVLEEEASDEEEDDVGAKICDPNWTSPRSRFEGAKAVNENSRIHERSESDKDKSCSTKSQSGILCARNSHDCNLKTDLEMAKSDADVPLRRTVHVVDSQFVRGISTATTCSTTSGGTADCGGDTIRVASNNPVSSETTNDQLAVARGATGCTEAGHAYFADPRVHGQQDNNVLSIAGLRSSGGDEPNDPPTSIHTPSKDARPTKDYALEPNTPFVPLKNMDGEMFDMKKSLQTMQQTLESFTPLAAVITALPDLIRDLAQRSNSSLDSVQSRLHSIEPIAGELLIVQQKLASFEPVASAAYESLKRWAKVDLMLENGKQQMPKEEPKDMAGTSGRRTGRDVEKVLGLRPQESTSDEQATMEQQEQCAGPRTSSLSTRTPNVMEMLAEEKAQALAEKAKKRVDLASRFKQGDYLTPTRRAAAVSHAYTIAERTSSTDQEEKRVIEVESSDAPALADAPKFILPKGYIPPQESLSNKTAGKDDAEAYYPVSMKAAPPQQNAILNAPSMSAGSTGPELVGNPGSVAIVPDNGNADVLPTKKSIRHGRHNFAPRDPLKVVKQTSQKEAQISSPHRKRRRNQRKHKEKHKALAD